jgi:hypothetical protein
MDYKKLIIALIEKCQDEEKLRIIHLIVSRYLG